MLICSPLEKWLRIWDGTKRKKQEGILCSEIVAVSGLHMNRRQPVAAPILFSFYTSRMASCYGIRCRYKYCDIYIMLMF